MRLKASSAAGLSGMLWPNTPWVATTELIDRQGKQDRKTPDPHQQPRGLDRRSGSSIESQAPASWEGKAAHAGSYDDDLLQYEPATMYT